MLRRTWVTLAILVSLGGGPAIAETLEMAPAPQARDAVVPRGLSMAQVEARFGAPDQRIAAVGNPPISRWVYPQFVVYFEGEFVIHAVSRPATS